MHPFAQGGHLLVALPPGAQYVHRERRSECSQRRPRCRVGRRYQPDDEQHAHHQGQIAAGSHQGKQCVAACPLDAPAAGKGVEQHAQHEEQQDDEELRHGAGYHVLLRLARVAAAQVPLHHVLVEAGHGNHGEHARQELLEEVLLVVHVVEEEHTRHVTLAYQVHHPPGRQPHVPCNVDNAQHHGHYKAQRFQRVSPNERLHPAAKGIEPHQGHRNRHVEQEGHVQRFEHQ